MLASLRTTVFAALVLVVGARAARAGDTQIFFDDNFAGAMTAVKIVDTTPGASATFTSTTIPNGGQPGAYREVTHNFSNGMVVVANYDPQFSYSPAQAPICSIDLGWLLTQFTPPDLFQFQLGVLQGGSWYGAPAFGVGANQWAGYIQLDLIALDFTRVSGSGPDHPDFSCSGSPLQFGTLTSTATTQFAPLTLTGGYDGWQVTLHVAKVTFFDDTFNPSDWTSNKIIDTTPGAGATFSVATMPSGGNPGAFRETTHVYHDGTIIVAHMNANAVHDPSVEPIYAVDFSADFEHINPPIPGNDAFGFRAGILQGSGYYESIALDAYWPYWVNYQLNNLASSDFTLVAGVGTLHPDFTSSGALLHFGYLTGNSIGSSPPVTRMGGIDNWRFVAHTLPECSGQYPDSCFGNDPSNPCPCYPSVPLGGAGRGCPNSVEQLGAKLIARGNANLSNDTVQLQAFGMPNSSCLYFQGTANTLAPFGDGLRCASGTIVRLGTKVNNCGASQYPLGIDPSVHMQGLVTTSGTRYYQAWYRNAAPFCTPSGFNLSNLVEVFWFP